jgi:hypothetical protein
MRPTFVLSVLLLASAVSACATQRIVAGTATYTSSPASPETSGALPVSTVVCLNRAHPHEGPFSAGVRFGDDCVLAGIAVGRGMPLQAVGECALPTSAGPLPLQVQTAVLDTQGATATVTIGGTTRDGRYVNYRFDGNTTGTISAEACDPVFAGTPVGRKPLAARNTP